MNKYVLLHQSLHHGTVSHLLIFLLAFRKQSLCSYVVMLATHPYNVPMKDFKVIQTAPKPSLSGKQKTISIDWLKPGLPSPTTEPRYQHLPTKSPQPSPDSTKSQSAALNDRLSYHNDTARFWVSSKADSTNIENLTDYCVIDDYNSCDVHMSVLVLRKEVSLLPH